ncbi:alpha/beta hydrolase [Microbacterium sp. NPDC087868]|uniref:alpha/beta hydrolase n=1 Tax=Microbacterium sp. NPDC087868 TaxID=3364195 RepID=UPI0038500270
MAHTLREIPSSAAMAQLGADAQAVGKTVWETMDAVNTQWLLIEGAFVVIPYGTPSDAMGSPLLSTSLFADVMAQARNVLVNSSEDVFAKLEQTRAELQGTIQNLNERHYAHSLILDQEIATFQADPANDPVVNGRNHPETDAYSTAKVNLGLLDQEAEQLALKVEMFNRSVDQAEQDLAKQLRGLSGGDVITQASGAAVTTSQAFWGLVPPGPTSGPGTAPKAVPLGDYLDLAIGDAASDRINWFTTAGAQDVSDWLAAHPEFFATIGFIPPAKVNEIWDGLKSRSTMDSSGAWISGPLATLWNRAPGAIGNLNGLKTADRMPWSEKELQRLLDDPTLTDSQRSKLELLDKTAVDGMRVLSVFIDDGGAPRASLVLGDPDTADQVITVTHGIATDLGTLGEWGTIASNLYQHANEQIERRGLDASTAVVLQMEWDSGWALTVWQENHQSEGARREVALVEGLRYANPTAWQEGWGHSLGTAMTATAQSQAPGVFDHLTLFGSAGVTPATAEDLRRSIAEGDVTVSATGSPWDWIAPLGRRPFWSSHGIDPRGIPGMDVFGSDGGSVPDFITEGSESGFGLPTGGHNAGVSEDFFYRIHRSPGWNPVVFPVEGPLAPLLLMPEDSVGYFDPRGESFKQSVADFAERVEDRG